MIIEGTLHLGEALSEAKVAQWLGISRTPVREAFARLEIEGLVVSEPQRRTRVFMPGPKDVDDICVVRDCLEKRALTLAMERRRTELASALARTADRMAEAMRSEDFSEYLRLDSQFHQSIFDHADNVFLCDAYQTIAAKLAALRTRLPLHLDYLGKGYAEHLRLSELIASGNLERALNVLEGHISRQGDSFWRLNDGLVDVETRRTRHGPGEAEAAMTTGLPSQIDRRKWAPKAVSSAVPSNEQEGRTGKLVDDNSAKDKSIDGKEAKNSVDERRRGRPRVHADDAARKRIWAVREREKKKVQRLILGQSLPKRGRPHKAAKRAERQNAGPDGND
jgi:DNA-binding GntR family transcriptional regulator